MCALWLTLISLAGFGHLLWPGTTPYSADSDFVAFHLGIKWHLYRSFTTLHQIPLWWPHLFSGAPALTNPQALYTYPLDFLFYLLPPTAAAGPTLFLHFVIMALGFHVLGRVLKLSPGARLLMATAGLFNFKVILAAYAGWFALVPILALLPWLLAAILSVAQQPRLDNGLGLCLATALLLHGGSPQLLYYLALLLLPYLALVFLMHLRQDRRSAAAFALTCLAASTLAVGLYAHLWLPVLADLPLTTRQAAGYDFFQGLPVTPASLLTMLWPEALGTPLDHTNLHLWDDAAYFGLVPLSLAVIGLLRPRQSAAVIYRFLAAAFILSILCALEGPSRLLYDHVPGFRLFRLPGRFLFLTAIFGIALCGVGFDHARGWLAKRLGDDKPVVRYLLAGILLVIAIEGISNAHRYLTTAPAAQLTPATHYRPLLAQDHDLYRVAPIGAVMNPGWAGAFDLELVTGYDPFNLAHYQRYFEYLKTGHLAPAHAGNWLQLKELARPDMLDALNVKYLLATGEISSPALELVEKWPAEPLWMMVQGGGQAQVRLYRNRRFQQRAYFPKGFIEVRDDRSLETELAQRDLREVAVVQTPGHGSDLREPEGASTAEVTRPAAGGLRVDLRTEQARYLLLSEVWHPGWQATLDGQSWPLERADLALMASWIPAGAHVLELRFAPVHQGLGRRVTGAAAVGALLWTALVLLGLRRRERRPSSVG